MLASYDYSLVIFRSYLLGVRYRELQENTTLIITLSAEGENCTAQDSLSVNLTLNGKHLPMWLILGKCYHGTI